MTRDVPPEDFFADESRAAYLRWQRREARTDNAQQAAHNKLIIENGDPEMEAAITALEQGWTEGR